MSFVQMSTVNPLGQRPLNFMMRHQSPPVYAGLLGWIGAAATPGDYDTNASVLAALVSMGAITQAQSDAIDAGTLSLDDLPVNMTMINEAISEQGGISPPTVLPLPGVAPKPITPLPAAPSTGSTGVQVVPYTPNVSATQIPSGTTLLYTASFQSYSVSGADVIAAITRNLGSHGMSVISSQVTATSALGTSPTSIQLAVLDSVGHALISDAKSILDSIANGASGGLASSNLTVAAYSGQSGSTGVTPPVATAGALAWIEQNAVWLGILLVAAVTLPAVIRKL